jgi:hypothetical protein
MNRFAHQVDRSRVRLDLREALATIVGLSRRFADMRRVVIDLVLPDEPASVETDPFVLLHAVYLPLRGALEGAAEGERLVVRLRGRTISIRGSRPGPAEGTEELQEMLLSMLEAAAEPAEAGRYAFALPAAMSPEEEDDE